MRAWISYRLSMTLPTKGSCVIASARSLGRGVELDVLVGVDLRRGQPRHARGAVLVDVLQRDLSAGDRLAARIGAGDERRLPVLADALVRADADRHLDLVADDLVLGDAREDRLGRRIAVRVVRIRRQLVAGRPVARL